MRRGRVRKLLLTMAALAAFLSLAQAVERKAKPPEQACQAQALASIARGWPNVLRGYFEITESDRCLVLLSERASFEVKRTSWLIDGKTGELLSEYHGYYDRGICSYRGGKYPTGECTWNEYLDKNSQM